MKKITLIFILFHFLLSIHAQIIDGLSIGIESNSAWYNDDKKTFDDTINQISEIKKKLYVAEERWLQIEILNDENKQSFKSE